MRLIASDLPPILVEDDPVLRRAADDLADDLARILGVRPTVGVLGAGAPQRAIIIAVRPGPGLDRPEACCAIEEGDRLLLLGADRLGATWAVYRACELDLGVEPLHAWTHRPPVRRDAVELRARQAEAPAVALRGFFLNDEDLLSEWRGGGGERRIDYPFYRQIIAPEVLDRVLDAVVRLRLNLVIPASFVDGANPAEAALQAAVVARGLYLTQHHIEPVGVSHHAMQAWAERRGETVPSYVREPERVRACWQESVRRLAVHGGQVVWAVGLRGRGDRAVWDADPAVAADPAARGALISRAMHEQVAMIRAACGPAAPITTVLWAEMADLHAGGHLDIPAGVVRVLCDHGPTQLWCGDFAGCDRSLGPTGVYVHAAYWGDGPHLAAGVRPSRLAATVGMALERGDTAYGLLNVANLRETVLAASQAARAWWNGAVEDEAAMLARWWPDARLAAAQRAFFDAYADQGARHGAAGLRRALDIALPDPALVARHGAPLLDGATRHKGCEVLAAIEARLDGRPSRGVHGQDDLAGAAWLGGLAGAAAQRFAAVERAVSPLLPSLAAEVGADARVQLIAQARCMGGLSQWCATTCLALASCAAGRRAEAHRLLVTAADALAAALSDRAAIATGAWAGWYGGDRKLDLPGIERRTRELAGRLAFHAAELTAGTATAGRPRG